MPDRFQIFHYPGTEGRKIWGVLDTDQKEIVHPAELSTADAEQFCRCLEIEWRASQGYVHVNEDERIIFMRLAERDKHWTLAKKLRYPLCSNYGRFIKLTEREAEAFHAYKAKKY